MDDEMGRAHERDYADKARVDAVIRAINALYVSEPPPRRLKPALLVALGDVAGELGEVSASIVRTWD